MSEKHRVEGKGRRNRLYPAGHLPLFFFENTQRREALYEKSHSDNEGKRDGGEKRKVMVIKRRR